MAQVQRFLVKMPVVAPNTSLSLAGQAAVLRARPLFGSITEPRTASVAAPSIWHIVEAPVALDMGNAWDVCHSMVTQGLGLAGGVRPEFAEPDLQQAWITAPPNDREQALVASCAADDQKTGPDGFPGALDNFWYQDDAHGQFARALADLPLPADDGKLVRVAHLDTGYDPDHHSLPRRLERTLQRNFVDDDRPNDAADDSSGFFNNLGHGTGTLSILAGAPAAGLPRLGAAPFVKVVPIRVANRVELFYNSAIAQAFDYVHGLTAGKGPESAVAVISMSMGGLASRAWADAVNALYEAGVVVVTAAGNNFGNLPTRHLVYPARFNRVIAACGVMADHSPYADLPLRKMAGNYGPDSKMRTALAASTPNVPWAKFGCSDVVDFDGAGTSAATPQIAAAAAMWLQKNKAACDAYSQPWMCVEAARRALFSSAARGDGHKLGNGELRVAAAMAVAPAEETQLAKEAPDSACFGFLKVLTGLGVDAGTAQQAMLELEALQLSQSAAIEAILPDAGVDPASLDASTRSALAKALAEHPRASQALRRALRAVDAPPIGPAATSPSVEALQLRHAVAPRPPEPTARRLRIYAYDPSLGRELETIGLNETISTIRWEHNLAPGPVGEYVEVVDVDPASGCCYAPVDLNDPRLLASDGLRPAEANPQFHQQMAYAVAMKTIEHFERALGRTALWSPRVVQVPLQARAGDPPTSGAQNRPQTRPGQRFVQRLRIYPHALREQNAYYSPDRKALLLGYFSCRFDVAGAPSQTVFTALSHDIVAHETTHALLDGLHPRFREPTNPDVLAFHEAFADIVALFQHFTLHESLRDQLRKVRGDLSGQNSLLAQLAVEFGRARGLHGGLRNAIGQFTDDGAGGKTWTPARPTIGDYQASNEPHARGAVLVAAVFDAFSQVYARRALRPISLATGGSEVLPPGVLSSELTDALTDVAAKVAGHVLTICIRALDYCPPVDITFGDFLRALVTADHDLVPSDPWGYRVAFVSAFAQRGIFPEAVRSLSVETVLWEPPPLAFSRLGGLLHRLRLKWDRSTHRRRAWLSSLVNARQVHRWLQDSVSDEEFEMLGLQRRAAKGYRLRNAAGESIECDLHAIEVHSVRPLQRVGPDGRLLSQLVVELTQSLTACDGSRMKFRGGATLLFDLNTQSAVYMVRKRFDQVARVTRSQAAWQAQMDAAGNNYTGLAAQAREPFAFLHRR
ncbi:S8 family serine peptidase [Thauera sp. 2A1]|uniref:S8 family serine peptidase n=1 Tax=Thauera sp. 2A1 TaxID=2570191 RepID=UPI001291E8AE|nr:S8 family serine peptidase [Thauera sp. 2A1]KAI5912185.1 S8 family serine peptidase [Thauera sp. 2A1]KAI5915009.1 S8 family serine peptidase [Thauera sp. 2A1]